MAILKHIAVKNADYGEALRYLIYGHGEIKAHHYIISFDPKDKEECGLTGERAQQLGMEYAAKNFPGHQALVCTHMDGQNGSGNIHVHIVINSLRKYDVKRQGFMERPCDSHAGYYRQETGCRLYRGFPFKSLSRKCQREKSSAIQNQTGRTNSKRKNFKSACFQRTAKCQQTETGRSR